MDQVRKAVEIIGNYTVKEGPNGGWRVHANCHGEVVSLHNQKAEAVDAAIRYNKAS